MQIRHKNVYHKNQNQDQELIKKIDNYITIFKKQISSLYSIIILSHEMKV